MLTRISANTEIDPEQFQQLLINFDQRLESRNTILLNICLQDIRLKTYFKKIFDQFDPQNRENADRAVGWLVKMLQSAGSTINQYTDLLFTLVTNASLISQTIEYFQLESDNKKDDIHVRRILARLNKQLEILNKISMPPVEALPLTEGSKHASFVENHVDPLEDVISEWLTWDDSSIAELSSSDKLRKALEDKNYIYAINLINDNPLLFVNLEEPKYNQELFNIFMVALQNKNCNHISTLWNVKLINGLVVNNINEDRGVAKLLLRNVLDLSHESEKFIDEFIASILHLPSLIEIYNDILFGKSMLSSSKAFSILEFHICQRIQNELSINPKQFDKWLLNMIHNLNDRTLSANEKAIWLKYIIFCAPDFAACVQGKYLHKCEGVFLMSLDACIDLFVQILQIAKDLTNNHLLNLITAMWESLNPHIFRQFSDQDHVNLLLQITSYTAAAKPTDKRLLLLKNYIDLISNANILMCVLRDSIRNLVVDPVITTRLKQITYTPNFAMVSQTQFHQPAMQIPNENIPLVELRR